MRIMRLNEVKSFTGLGRSSIYKFISEDTFPKSVSLGDRAVGWVSTEVEDWIRLRILVRDTPEGGSLQHEMKPSLIKDGFYRTNDTMQVGYF